MIGRTSLLVLMILAMSAPASAEIALEDKFFDSNGLRIRYVDTGRGEPVMLIHPFSESVETWQRSGVIAALADDFRVVAFDSRGHGKSDKPHDSESYGLEIVEDAARLLDHLQIRSAHVVGYSMGGYITGKFIAMHPERVLTATFGGSSPMSPMLWATQFESLVPALADALEQGRGLRPVLLRNIQPAPSDQQLDQMSRSLLADDDPLALAAAVRGFRETMLLTSEDIHSFAMPLLLVVGTADRPQERVDGFERTEPKIVFVEGATHSGTLNRPEFVSAVREFLTAHPVLQSSLDR
jgi:pimeloyl-ACP methyl ester carboxylesterase